MCGTPGYDFIHFGVFLELEVPVRTVDVLGSATIPCGEISLKRVTFRSNMDAIFVGLCTFNLIENVYFAYTRLQCMLPEWQQTMTHNRDCSYEDYT